MSARTDAILKTRGYLRQCLDLNRRLDKALVDATLHHAGSSLNEAAQTLNWADTVLDALCKQVELTRIALAAESAPDVPDQCESVAA